MVELEKSLKYVPTYQVNQQIRKEENKIARDVIKTAKDAKKLAKQQAKLLALTLLKKALKLKVLQKYQI